MKYIVMECHPAYVVVLDENGRIFKAANLHYEIGQTINSVIELTVTDTKTQRKIPLQQFYSLAAIAACLILLLLPAVFLSHSPAASVYMTINPMVRIDVNQKDQVIKLLSLNEDGETLISDYNYKKKDLRLVLNELADIAVKMDFLHENQTITLTLDSDDKEWIASRSEILNSCLKEHLSDKIPVQIEITDKKNNQVLIPASEITDHEKSSEEILIPPKDYSEDLLENPTKTTIDTSILPQTEEAEEIEEIEEIKEVEAEENKEEIEIEETIETDEEIEELQNEDTQPSDFDTENNLENENADDDDNNADDSEIEEEND